MAETIASMAVRIGANISDFEKKMNKLDKSLKHAGGKAFNQLRDAAVNVTKGVAVSLGALGVAAGGFGVKFNADMEQARISFETLLGSADKANKMIGDLQKFAAATPFEFPGLQNSAKLMLAMGFNADSVMPNLKSMGDAVAAIGGNEETLQGVTMALGQMLTKGKVSAEEMNQLAERGIPAWDLMAQKMGMSKEQLMKLSSEGKVFSDQAVPALIDAMGTKFSGAMDKQSKSFTGMMSTLRDNLNMMAGELTKPIFDSLKSLLPAMNEFVGKFTEGLQTGGIKGAIEAAFPPNVADTILGISNAVGGFFNFLKDNWGIIQPILIGVTAGFAGWVTIIGTIKLIKSAVSGLSTTISFITNPIGVAVLAIGALAVAGYLIYKNWDKIKAFLIETWETIKSTATTVWQGIKDFFIRLWEGIKQTFWDAVEKVKTTVLNMWDSVVTFFSEAPGKIATALTNLKNQILAKWNEMQSDAIIWGKNIIEGLWNGISSMAQWIKSKVYGFVSGIGQTIKDFFGIASPSKLMAEYGEYIGEGLAEGIRNKTGEVEAAAKDMAGAVEKQVNRTKQLIESFKPGGANFGMSQEQIDRYRFGQSAAAGGNLDLVANDEGWKSVQGAVQSEYERLAEEARKTGSKVDTGVLMDMAKANVDAILQNKPTRYHSGGLVTKLGPREVPAILEEGETVLPRGYKGGGNGVNLVVNIYGSVGVDDIGDKLVRKLAQAGVIAR